MHKVDKISLFLGLVIGISVASLFLIYQNSTKIDGVRSFLESREVVICNK